MNHNTLHIHRRKSGVSFRCDCEEVDRMERLKALCGRVVAAKVSPCAECCDSGWLVDSDLIAELKEASGETK